MVESKRDLEYNGGNNGDGKMPETNTVETGGMKKVVMEKIQAANSILILMKNNPSVDEMATAIGLEMVLDEMGKRATVLYRGEIPGEIRFLEPEKSFAKNTEVLQDFVISFKQIMADHLRYDIVDDEVRIYISPYRQKITENDLKFSYGDAAVDLVIELNIRATTELDRTGIEKVLNQAEIVEIATDELERTGQNTWINKKASSVAEMAAELIEEMPGAKIRREAANALLAGILMATEKFMNQKTTSETMGIAQKLMQAGASQAELIKEIEKGVAEAKATEKESVVEANTDEVPVGAETINTEAPAEAETIGTETPAEAETGAETVATGADVADVRAETVSAEVPSEVGNNEETKGSVDMGTGTGNPIGVEEVGAGVATVAGVAEGVATGVAGASVAGAGMAAGIDAAKDDVVAKVDAAATQAITDMAKAGEKKVKIPEDKIGEIEQIAEKMRAEKTQKEVEAKLDEMMAPKTAPIEEYQVEEVLGDGTAKAVERVRTAGVYPGAEMDDLVNVQPQAWRSKDYAAMMEKELEEPVGDENPAATAANAFGAGDAGANVPEMDYTATAGTENAPGFDPAAARDIEKNGANSAAVASGTDGAAEIPEMKAEPMRKIERPEAVTQTMTEEQLKQPWEIGMNTVSAENTSVNSGNGDGVLGDPSANPGMNDDFGANPEMNNNDGVGGYGADAGVNENAGVVENGMNGVESGVQAENSMNGVDSGVQVENSIGSFSVPMPNGENGGLGELSPVDGLPVPGGMDPAGGMAGNSGMPEAAGENMKNEDSGGNVGSGDVGAFHIPGM